MSDIEGQVPIQRGWQRLAGFFLLALILGLMGVVLVPAHPNSIWMDWEFTDWISPIANRISAGSRLYEDGLHLPMPPLPFILVHAIWPQGAEWINASQLYFLFQAGTILLLFTFFSKRIGSATAFITSLVVLPVYLSLPKTILYDSMAQFFVAACGIATAGLVCEPLSSDACSKKRLWLRMLLPGLQLALLALTKQNTFAGTILGVCVAMFFLPRRDAISARLMRIATVMGSTLLFFGVIAVACSRWISIPGLIHDVFLTGSEPKGGGRLLVFRLFYFGLVTVIISGGWGCVMAVVYSVARRFYPGLDFRGLLDGCLCPSKFEEKQKGFVSTILWTLLLWGAAMLVVGFAAKAVADPSVLKWCRRGGIQFLNISFPFACFFALCVGFRKLAPREHDWGSHPAAACAVVFFFGALFHSLSVGSFRWSYDNNPLVFSAIAFVVCGLTSLCKNPARPKILQSTWVCATARGVGLALVWLIATLQIPLVLNCTATWPEVRHLSGARLRPETEGMRDLVKIVRSHADPERHDTVLLLPNDPNIEAWFERDRPKLSCAIIFVDQYWDRYVADDLARLKERPPKVIVIGPRDYWPQFSEQWKVNEGVEKLINRIKNELLPQRYDLVTEQPIKFREGKDFMSIYVRRGQ